MMPFKLGFVPVRAALIVLALVARPDTLGAQGGAQRLVRRALERMGGESNARGIASTTADFVQATFGLGQEETPESPPTVTVIAGRVVNDFARSRRWITAETRPAATPSGVGRQQSVLVAAVGVTDNNGTLGVDAPAAVAAQARTMRQQPHRLLLSAMDNPASVTPITAREFRGDLMDGARYATRDDTLSLWFDRHSGYLTVVEAVTDDPVLGDRHTTTWYTRWTPVGELWLPRQADVMVNGRVAAQTRTTTLAVNAPIADSLFTIPDSLLARARQAPAGPVPMVVRLVELGPNVWRAEGGTHFSLVVEQPNGLVLVEAPQSAVRMRAVLDTLKSRFPDKPVRMAAMTHHHWDHSGGVREMLARGVPVVAHRRNGDFVRQVGRATKTLQPDALSRRSARPRIDVMGDSLVVGEGDSRVVLYELRTSHVEGMVGAYVPALRTLFVADVLSPGAQLPALGSREIVEFARSRGLTIERVAGAHGGVANWADVERAAR